VNSHGLRERHGDVLHARHSHAIRTGPQALPHGRQAEVGTQGQEARGARQIGQLVSGASVQCASVCVSLNSAGVLNGSHPRDIFSCGR
jgi:hypothetical protein